MHVKTRKVVIGVVSLVAVAVVTLVTVSPDARWVARHPTAVREVLRVRDAAKFVRSYHNRTGRCPAEADIDRYEKEADTVLCVPVNEGQQAEAPCVQYRVWSDFSPEECVLHYEADSDGFHAYDHFYLVMHDFWAEQDDMFRGGSVWQLMTKQERARLEAREKDSGQLELR